LSSETVVGYRVPCTWLTHWPGGVGSSACRSTWHGCTCDLSPPQTPGEKNSLSPFEGHGRGSWNPNCVCLCVLQTRESMTCISINKWMLLT